MTFRKIAHSPAFSCHSLAKREMAIAIRRSHWYFRKEAFIVPRWGGLLQVQHYELEPVMVHTYVLYFTVRLSFNRCNAIVYICVFACNWTKVFQTDRHFSLLHPFIWYFLCKKNCVFDSSLPKHVYGYRTLPIDEKAVNYSKCKCHNNEFSSGSTPDHIESTDSKLPILSKEILWCGRRESNEDSRKYASLTRS